MKWHAHCKYMEIDYDYKPKDLARFHGHLGPFIVLGYRMGRFALKEFGSSPFDMRAVVYCSGHTPESCLADGVQLGSGCTYGKGNISIMSSNEIRVEFFTKNKGLRLKPFPYRQPEQDDPDYELEIEKVSEELYDLADEELFTFETIDEKNT